MIPRPGVGAPWIRSFHPMVRNSCSAVRDADPEAVDAGAVDPAQARLDRAVRSPGARSR